MKNTGHTGEPREHACISDMLQFHRRQKEVPFGGGPKFQLYIRHKLADVNCTCMTICVAPGYIGRECMYIRIFLQKFDFFC